MQSNIFPVTAGIYRNFQLSDIDQRTWGRKFLSGVQGRSPGRGSGGRSLTEAEAVCRHCLQIFDCRNDQNLKISHNSPPDFLPVCFTMGRGDQATFWKPLAHAWCRHCIFLSFLRLYPETFRIQCEKPYMTSILDSGVDR